MASSTPAIPPVTGTTPTVSPEETNFLRFVNLVWKRAPKALRIHFDKVHPPSNLVTDLARQRTMLLSLKARKVINQAHWDTLFGVPNPMSKNFDVTLLICLLRNMNPSTPAPAGGFDVLPNPSDASTGADLARIKFYRNKVAHSSDARMNTNEFNTSWTDVEEAIGRLGDPSLLNEAKALRFSPIDESEKELLLELLIEIKQLRVEQLETVPWNIRELIEEKLKSWEEEDEDFVEIKASVAVQNCIKDEPSVVVVGHPGSGKSAIIHHIALKMGKEGFSVIPINRPEEIMTYHDSRNRQVFVVDDPCGEYSVNDQAYEWARYSEDITKCLNFKKCKDKVQSKLLVSCRLLISSTRAFGRIKVFSNSLFSLEKQENRLTFFERKLILESHLKCDLQFHKHIFEKHIDCFPLLCKLYVNIWADPERWISFFNNPFSELISKLDLMIDDPKPGSIYEYCSLVCCTLAEDKLDLYLSKLDQNEVFQCLHQGNKDFKCIYEIHDVCKIDLNPSELLSALNRQIGKYVKHVSAKFSLVHSKLLDIIVWHFGKKSPETLIRISSLEIFQTRLRPLGKLKDDDSQDLFIVELDENMLPFYTKRIQNDISEGKINDIFKNPCMPNTRIEASLFDLLVVENTLKETLLKRSYSLPSTNIEIFTFFSKEDLLEKGRLTFLHLTIMCNWVTFLEKLFESRNDVFLDTMFTQRTSTLYLAMLSENIQIVQRCVKYYSEMLGSLNEFTDFVMKHDISCLFCDTNPTNAGHRQYCPVTQVPILLLVCITGKLEILEYFIQSKICPQKDFNCEYQLFGETVTPLMVTSLYGHCSIVRYLLHHGASANYQNVDGISPLHEACEKRHLEVIKLLLSNDAYVNSRDIDGETPLSIASKNNFIEIVNYLLSNGADMNLQDSQGLTPIHKSISEGHINAVRFLIEKGCDINIASKNGDTPFSLACFNGDCAIVKLFIEKGIPMYDLRNGMQKSCVKGNKNIVSTLLENGVDINSTNTQGLSALHISSAQDNSDLVAYLLSKGADANIRSNDNQTPLHFAAKHFSEKCLLVLLQNKADINAVDEKERTALHYALIAQYSDGYFSKKVKIEIEHKGKNEIFQDPMSDEEIPAKKLKTNNLHFPIINKSEMNFQSEVLKKLKNVSDILIENKIDLNMTDIYGRSPLHLACSENFPEIAKTLIDFKANVNASDKDNCTPLHLACEKCYFFTVQLLVENEGNINATNVKGSSPLHLACISGNLQIVTTLAERGANVNISDNTGSTPLHVAIKHLHRDVIYFLISNGANVNAKDNDGFTPLMLCCRHNNKDVIEKLLKFGADINAESSEGKNAVATAVEFQHYDICFELCKKGAHLNEMNYKLLFKYMVNERDICKFVDENESTINKYRNIEGQSPLHLATIENKLCWVRIFLNRTMLFEAVDNKGQTACDYATNNKLSSIVELFLERCTSVRVGNHNIVRKCMGFLSKEGFRNPSYKYGSLSHDKIVTAALKHCRYFDIYNIILARLSDDLWSLHTSSIACLCPQRGERSSHNWIGQEEEFEKTFKSFAFDREFFEFQFWPLIFLRKDFWDLIKYLGFRFYMLSDKDFHSLTDTIGNNFLHYLLLMSDRDDEIKNIIPGVGNELWIKEASNSQNLAGCTPLHYAVQNPKAISELIELGADIEIKDKSGRDVLYYAKSCGYQETLEILESHLTKRSTNHNEDNLN